MNEIERNEKTEKEVNAVIAELKKLGEGWEDDVLRFVEILMENSEVKQ